MCVLAAAPAAAQGYVNPYIGWDFGGDSGCHLITVCEEKNAGWGISAGAMSTWAAAEFEFSYSPNFFGEVPDASATLMTVMGNALFGPRIGPVRPFLIVGLGLMKTHAEFTVESAIDTTNNDFGWNLGGGLMIMFGEHVGIRGDLRRIQTFGELPELPDLPGLPELPDFFGSEELGFYRGTVGLTLAF